jgi:hypothetical protein
MAKFRKKPVVIEAIHVTFAEWENSAWDGPPLSEEPEWCRSLKLALDGDKYLGWYIETLEGRMLASPGDWIIRGVKGELYPCKPDIFEQTYEAI